MFLSSHFADAPCIQYIHPGEVQPRRGGVLFQFSVAIWSMSVTAVVVWDILLLLQIFDKIVEWIFWKVLTSSKLSLVSVAKSSNQQLHIGFTIIVFTYLTWRAFCTRQLPREIFARIFSGTRVLLFHHLPCDCPPSRAFHIFRCSRDLTAQNQRSPSSQQVFVPDSFLGKFAHGLFGTRDSMSHRLDRTHISRSKKRRYYQTQRHQELRTNLRRNRACTPTSPVYSRISPEEQPFLPHRFLKTRSLTHFLLNEKFVLPPPSSQPTSE